MLNKNKDNYYINIKYKKIILIIHLNNKMLSYVNKK